MALVVRSSAIHEAGCYTTAPIRRGRRVIEYTGPRLTNEEADKRYDDRPHTFLFGLRGGKKLIDGHGMAAFINHSCDPNCYTDQVRGRVWIIALRDIAAGEELTYDYNLYDGEGEAACLCGAPTCRGTLYEPGEEPGGKKNRRRQQKRNGGRKKRERAA